MANATTIETRARSANLSVPPIIFACGTSGLLSIWGWGLIEALGRAAGQEFEQHLDVASIGNAMPGSPRPVFIRTDLPDEKYLEAAVAWNAPRVIFLGDPIKDFSYQTMVGGTDAAAAARNTTASLVAAATVCDGRTLIVQEQDRTDDVLKALIDVFGWSPDEPALAEIIERYSGEDPSERLGHKLDRLAWSDAVVASRNALPPRPWDSIIPAAIVPLYRFVGTGDAATIAWPREALVDFEQADRCPPLWMELAGAARLLTFGPFYHLPRGAWRVTATLGFADDVAGSTFSIEVVGSDVLARGRVRASGPGLFEASFVFVNDEPAAPLQVRVLAEQGSIFGRISIQRFTFEWIEEGTSGRM